MPEGPGSKLDEAPRSRGDKTGGSVARAERGGRGALASPEARPGRSVVAAFDLDGTLTRGGSVLRFLVATVGARRVLGALPRVLPSLVAGALLGGEHADRAKEALFERTLAGLEARWVAERAASFGRAHLATRARIEMCRILECHRKRGDRVVIVTASPACYVQTVASILGAEAVATELEVDRDGRLTGRYRGRNCRGAQKVRRLFELLADERGGPRPFIVAYGNSLGDRELLEAADLGLNAGRLGRLGRLRRFQRVSALTGLPGPGGADDPCVPSPPASTGTARETPP
jgi:phosphatidylglycerophosphatase C